VLGIDVWDAMLVHEKHSQDSHATAISPGFTVCSCVCCVKAGGAITTVCHHVVLSEGTHQEANSPVH
jgi:hypothetical protein